jgi:site-specific recombinase XerD
MAESELALLIIDWQISLEARDLSPATIESYTEAATLLDRSLVDNGITDLRDIDRRAIENFIIDQRKKVSPASVLTRFRSIRVLFNWLTNDLEEFEVSPMAKMKEPKAEDRPPDVPSDEDVHRLINSIKGKTFNDRRDLALLRFLFDTGARIGEVVSLKLEDIDVRERVATVYGKGRKVRNVFFGSKTASALVAYQRERRKHRYAELDELFIGQRGKISYFAAYRIVNGRARDVGFELHPHQTRHWFAHTWLNGGNHEGDLKAIGGWSSSAVMQRYGRSAAAARAREAHRRASPGDKL